MTNHDPNNVVRITQREIYDNLVRLRDDVAGVKHDTEDVRRSLEKIDARLWTLEQLNLKTVVSMVDDHEKRMRNLEFRVYTVLAAAVAAVTALTRTGVL